MKRFILDLKLSGETSKRSMNIYIYHISNPTRANFLYEIEKP